MVQKQILFDGREDDEHNDFGFVELSKSYLHKTNTIVFTIICNI